MWRIALLEVTDRIFNRDLRLGTPPGQSVRLRPVAPRPTPADGPVHGRELRSSSPPENMRSGLATRLGRSIKTSD
ncbi:hypothetical protein CORC01_12561 [Colletotrichum orchidophilum]|uniref:Uncharacterized protein n=1 Tax=Colletotrichum orchidophilum TaxID=1209926 RepID=A0A1G4ASL7_9PEZI|nr:uncharacterized protein CORC01_12561 [Colletotrichum orchidophilum]OHE92158.1 hypothetical protein CORC01_12561 [Colletotrichum orchidophilum]